MDAPTFARWVLRLSAIPNAAVGMGFLAAPARLGPFVDLEVASATADNDLRAVHGGVSTALAVFFWLASTRPAWIRPALVLVVLHFGGLAGGRFVSWAFLGLPDPIGFALHGPELVGLAAGVLALRALAARERFA